MRKASVSDVKCREDKGSKIFVIINSYLVGDILLVNPMIQNIKRLFPKSQVVMLTSEKLIDVAKYQEGVDDVVVWDRHGTHHGVFGMLKFLKNFRYKNVYAAIPVYGTDRPVILSRMMGAKFVLFQYKKNIFKFLKKTKYKIKFFKGKIQNQHINLLTGITKELLVDCRMKYNVSDADKVCAEFGLKKGKYVVLCPISSKPTKDMPDDTVFELLKTIKEKVVLIGAGNTVKSLSKRVFLYIEKHPDEIKNFVDLTNKTSIPEVAAVLADSKGAISVDTGMLHLACAVNAPTVSVFYRKDALAFVPDEELYNCKNVLENQTPKNILESFYGLFN